MKSIKNWLSKKWQLVKKSRSLLAIIMLLIGVSYTVSYYEFKNLWVDYQDALTTFERVKNREVGVVVTATAHASTEQDVAVMAQEGEKVNSLSTSTAQLITKVVYELETNSGKNPANTDQGCHNKGLHNGYGYIPGSCYASDEVTGKLVEKWFEKQLKTKTVAQALCFYNTGTVSDDCDYYQDYLKIK